MSQYEGMTIEELKQERDKISELIKAQETTQIFGNVRARKIRGIYDASVRFRRRFVTVLYTGKKDDAVSVLEDTIKNLEKAKQFIADN